ncbi:GNAT family N-acetyltransferase [Caldibacillus lycopersici]|uniref:GNAT family N-acetyltransferase n=1 Tax=Perspicuibacillus lycopersici TaxID=1325689 RepID=A0AAE3IQA6_9BACI|nr:GNAT family N-acetyltransferase [Perspicuibacillus lycopersici]MCU9612593.1 GNAT family N-acetyltransferase [Perspicuibacillus lycopersici]
MKRNQHVDEELISNITYRMAKKNDALEAAKLIHLAIDDIANQLTGQTKKEKIQEMLKLYFREENNRLSYQNAVVAEALGDVIGIVIFYAGANAAKLDEPILQYLRRQGNNQMIAFDQEADIEDFYIDTLCVSERFQGYGIGTKLIKVVENIAKQQGFTKVSLNVAQNNPVAKGMYKKLGYMKQKVITINQHPYDYMVKLIER